MTIEIENILDDVKNKLNLNGKKRIFEENKKIDSNDLINPQDPEEFTRNFLIDKILFQILELKLLGTNLHFKGMKETRKVDYVIEIPNYKILIEAKPINSYLYEKSSDGAVNQIKGLFRLAEVKENYQFGIATDGIRWIFIDKNGKIVYEIDIKEDFNRIKEILIGKEEISSEKIEEEISKKFYGWYNALLHGGEYKDHENKVKKISTKDCLVDNIIFVSKSEEKEQIAQTIMDRLIFIKFLQSKKIVSYDILDYLLNLDENILNEKLKQLFFQVFNSKKSERVNIDPKFKDIPYLNGSLFVRTDVEVRNPDYKIKAFILKEVIKFLDSFKFVHTEDISNQQILDPEILGYIFERAMNAVDRKGTGSYYTHKTITKYISESTIHPVIVKRVNVLLKEKGYKDSELLQGIEEVYRLRESTLGEIFSQIILNLKICDNACGSGAFLLAAADILLEIYKKINEDLRLRNSEIAMRKLILKNNLYGVDINPNAIEIAKLRLWLWLVTAYEPDKIEPLPNIDYNIRVGNSLIGYVDISKFKDQKLTLLDWYSSEKSLNLMLKKREETISKYKDAVSDKARELKTEIEEINRKIRKLLDINLYREISKKVKISEEEFQKTNPFHWGFEFYDIFNGNGKNEDKGFDVIIGNPPYIRVESLDHKFADIYKKLYESVYQRCDIYVAFIQTSFEKINKYGMVGLITANQYMVAEYGLKIRELLTTRYGISKIINFTHYSVFPGVSIYTAILIGSKTPQEKIKCLVFESEDAVKFMTINGLNDNIRHPQIKKVTVDKNILQGKEWVLKSTEESVILEKIKLKNIQNLNEISLIGSPLKTGRDSVLFYRIKKEDLEYYYINFGDKNLKLEKGIWRKIHRPRFLDKWKYKEPENIVFFPYDEKNGKFQLLDEKYFKEKFPLTYEFILSFKNILLDRRDSRKTWKELGRKWYSLHRVGVPENYFGIKILTQSVIKEPTFCIDSKNYLYPTGGVMGITPKREIDPYFLIAYLNSNLVYFILKSKAPVKRGGYISLDVGLISDIPIPLDKNLSDKLSHLTKEILKNSGNIGIQKKK